MKKIRKTVFSIFTIILAVAFGFGGGCLYCSKKAEESAEVVKDITSDIKLLGEVEKRTVIIDEVKTKLAEIGELSTYSGEYTVIKEAEYSRYFIDHIKIPGTKNTVHLECKGIVKVGYDIDDINVDVDNESHIIYISLPEASVNDNYVIWDTVKCIESNNPMNPIDFGQYQTLIGEIEDEGLLQSEEQGIYTKAEEHLRSIIGSFLSEMKDYKVKFL